MQLETAARPVIEILRAAIRSDSGTKMQQAALAHPRHDLADEIAALDEHWVFRRK